MANVSHASLTGSELHEPKGADSASLGTVYVADGAGSGSWASIGTSAFTGMIADFAAPVAPTGWLELDGSVISTSTYSGLFAVMSITSSGTRTNGNAVVTSIPTTTSFKAGYYVFGTGISAGTTILSVDSSTQITLSSSAGSSGTSSFFVSPWAMNTGTVTLPDLTTAGRYRRSRTSATKVGDLQTDQNKSHTHTVSGNTGTEGNHTHTYGGNTGNQSSSHTHSSGSGNLVVGTTSSTGGGQFGLNVISSFSGSTSTESSNHTHAYSGTTTAGTAHSHSFSATSSSDGGTEARPSTLVVMTCIKT
jgi:Phage Tail Collar Domain.